MRHGNRSLVALTSLLLAIPRVSAAQADCLEPARQIQGQLRALDRETRPLGAGFLTDNGLGVSLDAFTARWAGLSAADRSSVVWQGFRETEEARNKLAGFGERVQSWIDGIAGYLSCVKSADCSIGDFLKAREASNRQLADWLKSLGDEGLDRATAKVETASTALKNLMAGLGGPTTGPMASALLCMSGRPQGSSGSGQPTATAQTLSIAHQPVACAMAERFPRMEARFSPAGSVAVARVVFQGANTPDWYSVAMKPEGDAYSGVLPSPKRSLKTFRYYIEVTDKALETNRTGDYTTSVVASVSECQGKVMAGTVAVASVLLLGPAGAAAVPLGFASIGVVGAASGAAAGAAGATAGGGGGLSTGALVGIVGGVGAGVAAIAAKGGSGSSTTPAAGGSTPTTPTPTPAPTPTPTPAPTPTPTPSVAQYDGNYGGSFNGSFGGTPVNGPVAFNVNNGRLTLSEPGDGTGTVSASGSTTFGGKANLGIGVDCSFSGAFQGASVNGTWSCTGGGGSGSGSWNAQRQ